MNDARSIVYVVDDDEGFRDSLEALCSSVDLSCRSFENAQAFLAEFSDQWEGCVVLDIRMPGMSGVELFEVLRSRQCGMPVIFMTGHGDIEMAVIAIKDGAFDFLTKPFRHQNLLDRINAALRSEKDQREVADEMSVTQGRLQRLTPREHEVFALVVEGCANKVISNRLGISQRTVELHRSQVMQKMEAGSLADLVRQSLKVESAEN